MFPLVGKTYPSSPKQLAREILGALQVVFSFPNPDNAVSVEGAAWPAIEQIRVDLGGATVRVAQPPPKPMPGGARDPGIVINQVQVTGHPIWYQRSKIDVDVAASGVRADFTHETDGRAMLMVAEVSQGFAELKISKSDLRVALLAAASEAAKAQGVSILDLQIDLAGDGLRSVAVEVRVKAKKMMMSGSIIVRGKADVDSNLVARLYNLSCSGEGMVGNIAAGMVNSKLRQFEGKQIPLMALSLGDVKLRDVRITTQEPITLRVEFGRSPVNL